MKWFASFLLTLQAVVLFAAKPDPTAQYVASLKRVTDIMVSDVTSPVAAARYYAYTTLAAYEVLAGLRPEAYPPLSSALTHGVHLELPAVKEKDVLSCSVLAMWKTAYGLLPSGSSLKPAIDSLSAKLPASSLNLVDKTVSQVLAWVSKDGFQQLNNLKRYTPKRGPGILAAYAPGVYGPGGASLEYDPAFPARFGEPVSDAPSRCIRPESRRSFLRPDGGGVPGGERKGSRKRSDC